MTDEQSPRTPIQPSAGDIVVTRVASHYHVSRILFEGKPWVSLEATNSEADALTLACRLIRPQQRVFLSGLGSKAKPVLIDCANPFWEHR